MNTLIIVLKSYKPVNNSYSLFSNGMHKHLNKCIKSLLSHDDTQLEMDT